MPPLGWITRREPTHQIGQINVGLFERDDDVAAIGLETLDAPAKMPSAPDFDSLLECRSSVATTSWDMTSLPLWNSMPLRIFIVQVLSSFDEPIS